jgi:hypothetical protein
VGRAFPLGFVVGSMIVGSAVVLGLFQLVEHGLNNRP